ncbi:hypothetical protein SAMN04488009_2918 [Maribacter sedimenticola]|uniref:Uncharacterized protein n=1 Tax=Maribacter sedimenticola TaxID=228956 RepID=A0ABY1SJW5_9FLAO|nr:hypothetical protein [Maribacter sedimenticola]SNR64261.1 hypothetical protein SAMN04488009_2918 [Maribacter sedimenticola]
MDELGIAQLKDRILTYVMNHNNSKAENVYKALGNPMNDIDKFRDVAQNIFTHHHKYFKIRQGIQYDQNDSGIIYYKTDLTKSFLKIGGFTSLYEQNEKDLHMERKVKKASNKKTLYWWVPIVISSMSLLFSSYSILTKKSDITQEEINSINNKIDSLKSDFKKENNKLKEQLLKSDLLIAVYEDSIF